MFVKGNLCDEELMKQIRDVTMLFAAFIVFMLVGKTIWFQINHLFAMPAYDDVFDRVKYYDARASFRGLVGYFFSHHNEHRIVTTRLISIFDELVFQGMEYTQVFCSNFFQLCSALVCFVAIFRDEINKMPLNRKLFLISPLLLLFINPTLLCTLIRPFDVQYTIMILLCVVAAERISFASTFEGGPRFTNGQFWIPLLLVAFIATFTLGNGPIILLAAAVTSFILRWRLKFIIVLSALAIVHLALVLYTTTAVGTSTHDIIKILKFAAVYWGAPFMRFDPWPSGYITYANSTYLAAFMGMVFFAIGAFFGACRLFKPNFGGPVAVFGLVILIIVIATGFAAAHSRAQFGIMEGANKKYSSFASFGWVGVLTILIAVSRHYVARRFVPSINGLTGLVLLILLPISFMAYDRETHIWQKASERNWEGAIAAVYKINVRDPLFNFSHDPEEIKKYVRFTEASNVGAFAQIHYKWGDDALTILSSMKEVSCRGSAQDLAVIPQVDRLNVFDVSGNPATIRGWTWMDGDHAPATTILAVDSTNKIIGLGRTTRTGEIAEEWLGQKFGRNVGWFGFARSDSLSSLHFYAIGADDRSYCALGTIGNTR
jgi:hypothetical protein